MSNPLLQLLVLSYAAVGIVSTVAYWPTIRDLLAHKPSANTASYLIWTVTTAITFLYSIFILPDALFQFVSGMSFLACTIIFILRVRPGNKPVKKARQQH